MDPRDEPPIEPDPAGIAPGNDEEQAQHDLHQPGPGGADRLFFRRMLVIDHEDEPAAAANGGGEMRVRRADL